MARRSDHTRDELKEIILKAATQLIEKQGLDGLTARAVAQKIGYAPGTIYNVFSSMEGLSLTLNAQTLDALYMALNTPSCNNPQETPLHNMKAMAQLYHGFARNHRALWLMLFTHRLPEGQKAPEWYQEKINRLFEPLENLLKPYYPPAHSGERKIAARALWASVHGLCFLEETGKLPFADDKIQSKALTACLIDNFVRGIEKKE